MNSRRHHPTDRLAEVSLTTTSASCLSRSSRLSFSVDEVSPIARPLAPSRPSHSQRLPRSSKGLRAAWRASSSTSSTGISPSRQSSSSTRSVRTRPNHRSLSITTNSLHCFLCFSYGSSESHTDHARCHVADEHQAKPPTCAMSSTSATSSRRLCPLRNGSTGSPAASRVSSRPRSARSPCPSSPSRR